MRFFPLSVVVASATCAFFPSAQAKELSLPTTRVPFTLTASLQELNASPGQTQKLQEWVRKGGALRVSTDAATLFGFSVVQPRERTRERVGQRFGRAKAALPLGASPLLWTTSARTSLTRTDGFPGVRAVFYHLPSRDDVLLGDVGRGVPLLRVEDEEAPLYAAALRRYGRGWVVFAPRFIEARADGGAFEENIQAFLTASAQGDWLFLPSAALNAGRGWEQQLDLLPDEQQEGNAQLAGTASKVEEKGLALSKGEVAAIRAVWQDAADKPDDEAAQSGARALVALLRVRQNELTPTSESNALSGAPTDTPEWRDEFWNRQQRTAYEPFALWWNGVFALRDSEVTRDKTDKMQARPMEPFLDAADEALDWWGGWGGRALTIANGTESNEEARNALAAAGDVDDALVAMSWTSAGSKGKRILLGGPGTFQSDDETETVYNRMPLLVKWTPRGGAPCSMEIPATLADLPDFAPNPFFYGLPVLHNNPFNPQEDSFSWFDLGKRPPISYSALWFDYNRWKHQGVATPQDVISRFAEGDMEIQKFGLLPLRAVKNPWMNVPSASIRAQIIWRCGFLWSAQCPTRYGFAPLSLNIQVKRGLGHSIGRDIQSPNLTPNTPPVKEREAPDTKEKGAPTKEKGTPATQEENADPSAEFYASRWKFDVRPNRTPEAYIAGDQIVVRSPWEWPHPSLDVMRWLRKANSWRDDSLTLHRQYIALLWGLDESEATFTPARMARLSATMCFNRWLDDAPQPVPIWMLEGTQNLFSLDTGDFIEQSRANPDNVLMPPPPEFLPEIAQTTSRAKEFAEMELAARRQSMLCGDAFRSVDRRKGLQPRGGMALEEEDSTRMMRFFYARFGAGAVVETLQRIGAGQNANQALAATTGLTQEELLSQALAYSKV